MGFSALADMSRRVPDIGRRSSRYGRVTGVVIHYNYGVDSYGEATRVGREVSANYWITNAGVLLPNIDEIYRAWTSGAPGYPNGSLADHYSITFEVSNAANFKFSNPLGAISEAAFDKLARAIGDVFRRYSLGPVKRTTTPMGVGVRVHKDFVDTSCPGAWLMGRMDELIRRAEGFRTGGTSAPAVSGGAKTKTDGQVMLAVDGDRGPHTISRWQQVMGTPIDGVMSHPSSSVVIATQRFLNSAVSAQSIRDLTGDSKLALDGSMGPKTTKVLQFVLFNWWPHAFVAATGRAWNVGRDCDGDPGPITTRVFQTALNESWAGSGKLGRK